jgi:hypothetical protein
MLHPLLRSPLTRAALLVLVLLLLWRLAVDHDRPDLSGPFFLEFGRGSGWHGLNTVKVRPDGAILLHRRSGTASWEVTTLKLSDRSLARVRDAIQQNGLLDLQKEYDANITDGTQWVLLITQGEKAKAVYFNNNFPDAIVRFAADLDNILADNGLEQAVWRDAGGSFDREHERSLWDSIRR